MKKKLLQKKVKYILSVNSTMPEAFKPYPKTRPHTPSLIRRKINPKELPKSLLNVADFKHYKK